MTGYQDVVIEFENRKEMYKAMKPLKRKGYLKDCCEKIVNGKDNKSIIVSGTNIDDVTRAMEIYSRSPHGPPVKYKIKMSETNQEDKIRKELQREFEIKDRKRIEEKQNLESKWNKERTKYQDDISGMRIEIERLENQTEHFESLFENSQEDLKQEKRDYQELKIKLDDTYSELEEMRKEFETYYKSPIYKKIMHRLSDLFSK